MYRFWYSFIPGARAAIEMNRGEVFYKNYVKEKLHSFMGKVFEDMCRYYRSGLIDKRYEEVEFLLFSLTGFSKWVKENVRPDRVRFVTLEELYQNR
ncbi:MAG: hypothetical protein IKN79_05970 [Eubacterium sp.]|nr:hypothetical protein [Eubacterium sp.]